MNIYLLILFTIGILWFIRYLLIYHYVPYRKKKLRPGVQERVLAKINYHVRRGRMFFQKKKGLKYIGYFGCIDRPKKFYVISSGAHGLETMAKEIGLDYVNELDEDKLKELGILVISIPIINWHGFKNFHRTDENGYDPMRSGPKVKNTRYKRKLKLPWRFGLSGWYAYSITGFFMRIVGNKWYRCAPGVPRYWREFFTLVTSYLDQGIPMIWPDLHSGEPDPRTVFWNNGLGRMFRKNKRMRRLVGKYNLSFGIIDYRIERDIQEYFVARYGRDLVKAHTIEFSVHDDITGLNWSYFKHYIFGSVFDPPIDKRKEKVLEGVIRLRALLKLPIKKPIIA